jgi:hypothetical protein
MDFADGHGWNLPRRGASKRPAVPAAQTSVTVSKGLPLSVVQKADAYNCWPMFGRIGRRLVCSYSRGAGHTIVGGRGAYVRFSDDGGDGWSAETRIADDPTVCEMAEGVGLDDDGAMLMWMYCNGGGRIWHELLRTRDGVQYEKTAKLKLSPVPTQVMDIVQVPGVGLMSTWFAGDYRKAESGHSWGTLVSADNGRTWVQRTVESDLPRGDWPTEISLAAVGGGRLIAIGRSERTVRRQFQLTSRDGGRTWKKSRTNIRDVNESTPALVYDGRTGLLSNYYYQRGPGILWRRTVRLDDIFDSPESWPEPVEVARGGRDRPYDSGNVKAVADGSVHRLVFYSGNPTNTEVVMVTVPADPFGRK